MKKLNNKGFAISTMLYGILTMIILILMLLLNIMRSSYNKENIATSDITYYMNKCISKQVSLENCYKKYDANPAHPYSCRDEYEAYISCIGSDVQISGAGGKLAVLSRLITDNSDSSNSGLIVDSTNSTSTSKRYIYTGANPNNYVKFGNKNARILALESDGTVKIVITDNINAAFDKVSSSSSSGSQKWKSSTLYNTFKSKYNSMDYTSKLAKGNFYTGAIYDTYSTKEAITSVRQESIEDNFGLVSLEDYFKASGNITSASNKCDLSATGSGSVKTAMTNCSKNNWLNGGSSSCYWTVTGYNGVTNISSFTASGVTARAATVSCNSQIVVYLKDGIMTNATADGSQSNPYVIN